MTESPGTVTIQPAVAVEQVRRVPGRATTLNLLLRAAGGDVTDIIIQRSLNPALFDFMAKHAS